MMKSSAPVRAPGALPLLGHSVPLLRDPLAFLASLPTYGDLVEVRLGSLSMIVVCDPELTRQLLHDDARFDKGGVVIERERESVGDGLSTCPHVRHRRQRRLTQPAFHHDRFRGYIQVMADQIATVTARWRDGQLIEIPAEMTEITMGTTLVTMFASGLSAADRRQATDDLTTVVRGIYRRIIMPPIVNGLPTPGNRRYDHARARLRRTIAAIIAERRGDPTDRGDLLSALLAARDTDGGAMTDTEISDQVITFFIGGTETTANLTAWALHLLAEHPTVAEQLRVEADTVLGTATGTVAPSPEELTRLELTRQVITETLRLYPPVWIHSRSTTTPTRLGGHQLPAGTNLAFSPYLLHRRPDLFDDPERFHPQRWDGHHTPPIRGVLIPFGAGPRKCIGDQFAMTMATLTLASITAHWKLEPAHRPRRTPALILRPHGLRMYAFARGRRPATCTPPLPAV